MSGQCGKRVGAPHVARRRWPVGRERILALDVVVLEPAHPVRADHERAGALGADQQEADARVVAQRRDERRPAALDRLERHAPGLAREADQPEVAGGHDRELRDAVGLLRERLRGRRGQRAAVVLAELHGAVDPAAAHGPVDHARGRALAAGRLRQRRGQHPERLVVSRLLRLDLVGLARARDELLQRQP